MSQLLPHSVPGYIIERPLGEGTAGVVYKARPTAHSSHPLPSNVAIKVIPRSKVREAVRREVALHLTLRHPNIARLYHVAPVNLRTQRHSHSTASQLALALVMDYASPGDMFNEVASAAALPAPLLRRRLRHICQALHHLHSNNIVHLDLKLENVVISNSSTAQLIDFGCARRIDEHRHPSLPVQVSGTLHYLPPELLDNPALPPATSSDAWSLGVLAYTALSGIYPFNGARRGFSEEQTDAATRRRIRNAPPHRIPSHIHVPSDLRTIIDGLLDKNPATRITIPQVIQILDNSMPLSNNTVIAPNPCANQQLPQHKHHLLNRPPSPASCADADFSDSHCIQSVDEALYVVDDVQSNRLRQTQQPTLRHLPSRAHDHIVLVDRAC
ncbi:CBL-interacting protein kinase 31 [Gracilariopsis chorda]|uniref:CBL-interacting protein kinase 31 n=1 Tax=Gracilariopsis chorda TaxID=448386 RepID=A0A2V3J123_9FLOR|nr:CBL-interacting protein kinase 31 [Gracilariopsis chorda]|eukprot:PXF48106.1 CBL-interacting protein kinase 31 [Gracilariopsis chorda]